jgi:NitT/TauT family transport system ATP-binding protein
MQEELLALWDQLRFTVLFVTHSIEEAIIVGSRILVLSPHPGRVRAELDADVFNYTNLDGAEFGTLSKRIHRLLFEHEEPGVATVAEEAESEHDRPAA